MCHCLPAPKQLIFRGLFACAPIAPTLAVDIEMLQFLRELFVCIPLNNTAWTETLESFWAHRRYKLETRVSLPSLSAIHCDEGVRQNTLYERFANAYRWYSALVNATHMHINDIIEQARERINKDGQPRLSEFLRRRCPLCCGAADIHDPDFV